jgi:hypothetical protein
VRLFCKQTVCALVDLLGGGDGGGDDDDDGLSISTLEFEAWYFIYGPYIENYFYNDFIK